MGLFAEFEKPDTKTTIMGIGFGMALTALEAWRYPIIWVNSSGTALTMSGGAYACLALILMAFFYGIGQRRALKRSAPLVIAALFLTITLFCYGSLENGPQPPFARWLGALHMAAGMVFFVLWTEELILSPQKEAVQSFAIGLAVAFAAQCAVVLLNASMAHGVCATFPLVSASLFLLGRAQANSFFGCQAEPAPSTSLREKPKRTPGKPILVCAFALTCGVLFNLMNRAWQSNIINSANISETNVQFFSALGSLMAALLLAALPARSRQQLMGLFITVLTLMALLASNMGAGVFPLYLAPLNGAQKLAYALFFLIALNQPQLRRGMLFFCVLLLIYRWGLSLLTPLTNLLQGAPLQLSAEEANYAIIVAGSAYLLAFALSCLLSLAKQSDSVPEEKDQPAVAGAQLDKETIEKYKAIAFQYYRTQKYRLTSREAEIALLLENGGTQRSIAELLVISQGTAKCHIRNVYTKLGVHSKEEAIEEMGRARNEFFET